MVLIYGGGGDGVREMGLVLDDITRLVSVGKGALVKWLLAWGI